MKHLQSPLQSDEVQGPTKAHIPTRPGSRPPPAGPGHFLTTHLAGPQPKALWANSPGTMAQENMVQPGTEGRSVCPSVPGHASGHPDRRGEEGQLWESPRCWLCSECLPLGQACRFYRNFSYLGARVETETSLLPPPSPESFEGATTPCFPVTK
jgi:hypothetical protein